MPLELTRKKIKDLVLQLPPDELLQLLAELEDEAETLAMMRLAEPAFDEWNEEGEDIYDEDAQAR